ncbi:MAG: hypothetical protein KF729_02040 [Sandaracinaceae bacterium]|nr:hypothetical protein [Sandaracinaceae bacterium]
MLVARRAPCLLVAAALAGCGEPDAPEGARDALEAPYIAFAADFARFREWERFERGIDPVPPTHFGESAIYLDRRPPAGAREFPVGTRIVRVETRRGDPSAPEVHAMVKRGAGYNAEGARGWEFFDLALAPGRAPSIRWRGEGPADGDGYTPPEGGAILSCNHCHGSATDDDSVLSPALALSALAPSR